VQHKERFPDGAVLVEWGKDTGDDVCFLHKLEELAAKIGCAPEKSGSQSMVCCLESCAQLSQMNPIIAFPAAVIEEW
jgi:hypothetical protein